MTSTASGTTPGSRRSSISTDLTTPEAVARALEREGYLPSADLATALYLAAALDRPLLLEGPPGVGKTDVARRLADAAGRRLVRLQCYEGLDDAKALYEWSYGKQMLYAQLLRDRVDALLGDAADFAAAVERLHGHADAFFSREFLLPRPLLTALLSEQPVVLLVDEVDRADPEFEAFLLELLAEWQITVPELGTLAAPAGRRPWTVLTSNASRDLSDALRRRCLFHHIDPPDAAAEAGILRLRAPDLDEALRAAVVRFVDKARQASLRRAPSTAETIDWALSLVAVQARELGRKEVRATVGALIKDPEDQERILQNLQAYL